MGRFGHAEDGRPVSPRPDEVRAITQHHAEKVIDLIDTLSAVEQRPAIAGAVKDTAAKLKAALDAYAEDFGNPAARQLEAYARRKSSARTLTPPHDLLRGTTHALSVCVTDDEALALVPPKKKRLLLDRLSYDTAPNFANAPRVGFAKEPLQELPADTVTAHLTRPSQATHCTNW